ncbi:uncharacterized protein LOC104866624 isoform X1 [Fukomys damarensis]|uniref:uncharacterized protein LOC104866624 isoform X1 n=1 Tax=Fukomys damarensis TaxID=885580 RepID=UPI00145582E0|nr:uncharacterized protein LOC104866624 isoform X1 [Fukomys damarensis]
MGTPPSCSVSCHHRQESVSEEAAAVWKSGRISACSFRQPRDGLGLGTPIFQAWFGSTNAHPKRSQHSLRPWAAAVGWSWGSGKTAALVEVWATACKDPRRTQRDSPGDRCRRPEWPTHRHWPEQWCHLADSVGAAHGNGGGDPNLQEALLEDWGAASAPAWVGQRLLPSKPGFGTPRLGPKGGARWSSEPLLTTVVYKATI